MSPATGLDTFDTTLHTTHAWLDEVMEKLGWADRHRAYHALRSVLHALRDRLSVDEGAHLSAQLPMLIRGIYYEGWRPADSPTKERTKDEFLNCVCEEFDYSMGDTDFEQITRAVFEVLNSHIDCGECEDVKGSLPAEIKELWP